MTARLLWAEAILANEQPGDSPLLWPVYHCHDNNGYVRPGLCAQDMLTSMMHNSAHNGLCCTFVEAVAAGLRLIPDWGCITVMQSLAMCPLRSML